MNVLAIGAHPDDIEYGCGGMLTKYAQRGHDVYLWVASDGSLGGDAEVRRREQQDSATIIGAREVFWGEYPDTEIPLNRELIVRIESVIKKIKPRMILVHYPDDTHQDHRNLAQGTLSATRYVPNFLFTKARPRRTSRPTASPMSRRCSTRSSPAWRAHRSQVAKTNIEDLTILELAVSCANFRGIQARAKYAEAFSRSASC